MYDNILIFLMLITILNALILGMSIKLYTEYFKDRSAVKRGEK